MLFVGIVFGALGLKADSLFLHFLKEFGLVLFMFTIGFQVGPSFFSSFRKHRISELLAKFEGRYSVTAIERGADSFTVVDDPVLEAGDRVCADLSSESRMMLRLCFGKKIKDLHLDRDYGVTVVRILRSGVELVALGDMYIQMGDGLKVIGSEEGITLRGIRRLSFRNIRTRGAKPVVLTGAAPTALEDITLENVSGTIENETPVLIRNVRNLKLNNVQLTGTASGKGEFTRRESPSWETKF